MYGVSKNVDRKLEIYDLTHGITPFQVLEGSYRVNRGIIPYVRSFGSEWKITFKKFR